MRLVLLTVFLAFSAATLHAAEKSAAPKSGAPKSGPAQKAPAAQKAAPAANTASDKANAPKASPHALRVFLVGDSIVGGDEANAEIRGWGDYFQMPGNTIAEVFNRAKKSRSAKTFQMEGLWTQVLAEKPEVVLIEFGHNDSILAGDAVQKAIRDYTDALGRYIHGTRKAGGNPVLVSPAYAPAVETKLKLSDFAAAMHAVADAQQVPFVDLYSNSAELAQSLGPEGWAQLHAPGDPVHFNELGAKTMAEIVRRELARADLKLAWKIFGSKTPLPPGVTPPGKQ